jgi:hypothetical protein
MNGFRKGYNLAVILTLIGVMVCQDGYALRVPMNGHKSVEKALASDEVVLEDVNYDGFEKERIYYETIIGWVTHILENYNTQFGGNKLVFIGGACKRAWQAAMVLCKQYGVNKKDIIYLDLPRVVHRRTNTQIISQYLKQQGLFDKEEPIAVFDNMVNSEGVNSTFRKVVAAIRNVRPQSKVIHYILDGESVASYSREIANDSRDSDIINRTDIFVGTSNWMKTDIRREKLISYEENAGEIAPQYLSFVDLSNFLSEIEKGTDIFNLDPKALSEQSRHILSLIYLVITDMGYSKAYGIDWDKAYDGLVELCESNPVSRADMQDKLFKSLLEKRVPIKKLPTSNAMDYAVNAERLWTDNAKRYIIKFNQDNLSLDRSPFFIGVKHEELSKNEKEEILKALKLQKAKKVGIELFVGNYTHFKPGDYWLGLMDFLKREGFDVILLEKDLEIVLETQIIQSLRNFCVAGLQYVGSSQEEFAKKMQIYQETLEENYILYRKVITGLSEETFYNHELMGREYFSRLLSTNPGDKEHIDLFYELEGKFTELNIKTSFEMLKVSQDEEVDAMISGAGHIAHLLVLTGDNTWPGIILNTDIKESTRSAETIVHRNINILDTLQRNLTEKDL